MQLGCSSVICTLGLEVGHPFSTENIKIHSKVTTTSEVRPIICWGIKTCVDTLWKCLWKCSFFYMTRCGVSLSNLDEPFYVGLTDLRHHVYFHSQQSVGCYIHHGLRVLCDTVRKNVFKAIIDYCWIWQTRYLHSTPFIHPSGQGWGKYPWRCVMCTQEGSQIPPSIFSPWLFRDSQILPGELSTGVKGNMWVSEYFPKEALALNLQISFLKSITCSW